MEQPTNKESFISKYWANLAWVAGVLFLSGGVYSKFELQQRELQQLRSETEEIKEQLFKEIEQRVDDLEEDQAYQKGKADAEKEYKITLKK